MASYTENLTVPTKVAALPAKSRQAVFATQFGRADRRFALG